ncbi:MAG TPA: DUF4241 domain-containing protein [Tepidisphaeraceae bacterium]|jgi:hypothetical protein|nr:DUF4241 domain-containing protein [Tepidisphaeraceae bacterium]
MFLIRPINITKGYEAMMQLSTSHVILPDASAFADVLGSELVAHETFGDRTLSFRAVQLPALKVPSGRITASDGYILDAKPFAQLVPVGEHRLLLAIAVIETDERIAFAKLQFADAPVTRWEIAVRSGQDPKSLKPGEVFGYGVDSGTGCFGDSEAYKLVSEADGDFPDKMMAESQMVYRHTRDWLSIETTAGSFAVFSSGYGDGFYASYFGYSAAGSVVSLVTDFGLAKWAAASTIA